MAYVLEVIHEVPTMFQIAAHAGVGAPLHAIFPNGVVLKFVKGRLLTWDDWNNPVIVRYGNKAGMLKDSL